MSNTITAAAARPIPYAVTADRVRTIGAIAEHAPREIPRVRVRVPFCGLGESITADQLECERSRLIELLEEVKDHGAAITAADVEAVSSVGYLYRAPLETLAQYWCDHYAGVLSERIGAPMTFERIEVRLPSGREARPDVEIYADMSAPQLCAVLGYALTSCGFRERVRAVMTPVSGWIPFYPQDVNRWGAVNQWAPAQIELLLDAIYPAWRTTEDDPDGYESADYRFSEHMSSCGIDSEFICGCVEAALGAERAGALFDALYSFSAA